MFAVFFIVGLILLYASILRVEEIPQNIKYNSQVSSMEVKFSKEMNTLFNKFILKYFTKEEIELASRYKYRVNTPPCCYMQMYEAICNYDELMAVEYLPWKNHEYSSVPMEYILAENQRREFKMKQTASYLKSGIKSLQRDMDSIIGNGWNETQKMQSKIWVNAKDQEVFFIDIIGADNFNGLWQHVVLYNNPYHGDVKKQKKKDYGVGSWGDGIFYKSNPKVKTKADKLYALVSEKSNYFLEMCMNNYDEEKWKFNPLPPIQARDYVLQQIHQITEPRLRKVSHDDEMEAHLVIREKIRKKCEELGLMEMHKYATPLEELDPNNSFRTLNGMFCTEEELQEPWKLDLNSDYYIGI